MLINKNCCIKFLIYALLLSGSPNIIVHQVGGGNAPLEQAQQHHQSIPHQQQQHTSIPPAVSAPNLSQPRSTSPPTPAQQGIFHFPILRFHFISFHSRLANIPDPVFITTIHRGKSPFLTVGLLQNSPPLEYSLTRFRDILPARGIVLVNTKL